MKRQITIIERAMFAYLHILRESGAANMFGATPYLQGEFPDYDKKFCSKVLTLWMENYREDKTYDEIVG